MTTRDRERWEGDVRAYMDALDGISLERLVQAEEWVCEDFVSEAGCCLVGHAEGLAEMTNSQFVAWCGIESERQDLASEAFIALCYGGGIARAVALVQAYAAHLIATRAAAAVAALCGEHANADA